MNLLLLIQSSFRELQENLAEEVLKEPKDPGFVKILFFIMLITQK